LSKSNDSSFFDLAESPGYVAESGPMDYFFWFDGEAALLCSGLEDQHSFKQLEEILSMVAGSIQGWLISGLAHFKHLKEEVAL